MTAVAEGRSTPELDARAGFEKLATYPYQIGRASCRERV